MLLTLAGNRELVKRYESPNYSFGIHDVNDFFEKASYEAVSIMVFFQVFSISYLLYKLTSLFTVLSWLSLAFLVYSLAGPYFCLKWMLILSSLVWHFILLLWTHPYLIACLVLCYAGHKIFNVFMTYNEDSTKDKVISDMSSIKEKLDCVDRDTKLLTDIVNELNKKVDQLPNVSRQNSSHGRVDEWVSEVSYPLDRRRMSRRNLKSQE